MRGLRQEYCLVPCRARSSAACATWIRCIGAARDQRNALAIEFAAFEFHRCIGASRILAEEFVESDERLDEIIPSLHA